MSDAEEKLEWIKIASRYEERLTGALAESARLRAALKKAHDWISPFTDPLNYTAAEMAKEIEAVLNN